MTMDKTGKDKDGGDKGAGQNLQQPGGQTSAAEQLTSKIEDGKQYAGADVKKMVGDALSADGREQKDRAQKAEAEVKRLGDEHGGLINRFNAVSNQVTELLKAQDESEADKIKDDPAALTSLRFKQANRAEKIRLEGFEASVKDREAKLGDRETNINKRETSVNIKLAAMAAGVDEAKLADLVPDGDPGRLSRAANILKQSGLTTQLAGEKNIPAGLKQTPASAISAGGDGKTTAERMLDKAKEKTK